jgi:hypothetical protein
MPVQLQPETQNVVDTLLYEKDQSKRREALKTVNATVRSGRKISAGTIYQRRRRWRRTWTLSVLAELACPRAKMILGTSRIRQNLIRGCVILR